jgi:hypothetical protein
MYFDACLEWREALSADDQQLCRTLTDVIGSAHKGASSAVADSPDRRGILRPVFKSALRRPRRRECCAGIATKEAVVEHVNAREIGRLSKSNMEMSDHIVVLTAIVGAMVTRASVDYGPMIPHRSFHPNATSSLTLVSYCARAAFCSATSEYGLAVSLDVRERSLRAA